MLYEIFVKLNILMDQWLQYTIISNYSYSILSIILCIWNFLIFFKNIRIFDDNVFFIYNN